MLRRNLLAAGLVLAAAGAGVYLVPGLLPGDPAAPGTSSARAPESASPAATEWRGPEGASVPSAREVADELAALGTRLQTPDRAEGATSALSPLLLERARARGLGGRPPSPELLEALGELGYDAYRDIRFRPEEAIWRGQGPFQLQLFHPGFIQTDQVELHRLSPAGSEPLAFDPALFDYAGPASEVERVLARRLTRERERGFDLAPSGFRIHHPLNTADVWDELAVFLGASYFRLLGPGHAYGISGRGLAVNTTRIGSEEFPVFREFWMLDPAPGDDALRFWARLDGESVTGAYHFVLRPGRPTVLEVEAHLHVHRPVEELGFAPLTSMFLTAPTLGPALDDIRPRIHDSDGLLVHTAGDEWIWRPLSNGPGLRITETDAPGVRGFGLLQRNRNFEDFLDLEARYHDRPSFWVEVLEVLEGDAEGPAGWGPGSVRLLELPTPSEFDDNIVAFWSPDGGAEAGDEFRLRYRVVAFDDRLEQQTLAQVSGTRVGSAELPGATPSPRAEARRFVVDFSPAPSPERGLATGAAPPPTLDGIEVVYRASTGRLFDVRAELLPGGRGWRATFALDPEREGGASGDPVASDLALYLQQDGERLTETWAYRWIPATASAAAALPGARP